MSRINRDLITELAADLRPTRSIRLSDGLMLVVAACVLTIGAMAIWQGIWRAAIDGSASAMFYLVNALLAVFGISCATAALRMATPGVGNRYDGAYWALGMLAVLPVVASVILVAQDAADNILNDPYGLDCALVGSAAAVFVALALFFWLRRGAPVNPNSAGLLVGLASGALGSAAYGLSCPIDTLEHLAIWHIMPVAVVGALGRAMLPRLLRW